MLYRRGRVRWGVRGSAELTAGYPCALACAQCGMGGCERSARADVALVGCPSMPAAVGGPVWLYRRGAVY